MGIIICKYLSRPLPVRQLLSMSSQPTPSRMSKPKFKIRRVFHQISRDSFSPESNLRMVEPFLTTTSKRSPLFTWFSDSEEEVWVPSRSNLLLPPSPESSSVRSKSAESSMPDSRQRPLTAERESVVTTVTSDPRRRSRAEFGVQPTAGPRDFLVHLEFLRFFRKLI